jgi:hypothetical protein
MAAVDLRNRFILAQGSTYFDGEVGPPSQAVVLGQERPSYLSIENGKATNSHMGNLSSAPADTSTATI